jgi:hypothetical protein
VALDQQHKLQQKRSRLDLKEAIEDQLKRLKNLTDQANKRKYHTSPKNTRRKTISQNSSVHHISGVLPSVTDSTRVKRRKRLLAQNHIEKMRHQSVDETQLSQPSITNVETQEFLTKDRPHAENRKKRSQPKSVISGDDLLPSIPIVDSVPSKFNSQMHF